MTRHLYAFPPTPRGDTELNPARSYFSVIVPEESVNLVFDPEFLGFGSGATTGYDSLGLALIAPTSLFQRRGVFGAAVTNVQLANDGIRYVMPLAPAANLPYTFSFDHIGRGVYLARIRDTSTTKILASYEFEGDPFWRRIAVTAITQTAGALSLEVVASPNNFAVTTYQQGFHVDGFQLEQKPYATTFISGDVAGFPHEIPSGYGWLGTPHNSASFRLSSTRSGGKAVSLDQMGLHVLEFTGLGMPDPEHGLIDYALAHGSEYGCTRLPSREFSIIGQFAGKEAKDWLCSRQKLVSALNPLKGLVRLQFQLYDCDVPISEVFDIDALYQSGMDLRFNSHFGERASISFVMPKPLIASSGAKAAEIGIFDYPTEGNPGLIARGPAGNWQYIEGAGVNPINDLAIGPDGLLYALVNIGAGQTTLARWDGATWNNFAIITGNAYRMAAAPNNHLYIVGDITGVVGQVLAVSSIVSYNVRLGTWGNLDGTVVTEGFDPFLRCVAHHKAGYLIVGGNFTGIDNANMAPIVCNDIAAYNLRTEVWDNMNGGLTGSTVEAIAIADNGLVFAGGRFALGSIENLACYDFDTDAWTKTDSPNWDGDPTDATVYALAFGPNGRLYVGGRFNDSAAHDYTNNGYPAATFHPMNNIAYYDATGKPASPGVLEPVGAGTEPAYTISVTTYDSTVRDIAVNCDGEVFIVGSFRNVYRPVLVPGFFTPMFFSLYSPGVASFGPDLRWRNPEVLMDPIDNQFIGITPEGINAVEFGVNCQAQGNVALFGGGVAGTGSSIGIPPGYSGSLFVGYSDNPSFQPNPLLPATTVIDVGCSVDVKPVIRITGPGSLYAITNYSNGSTIGFRPLLLDNEETITIDLESPFIRIYSNVQSNVASYLVDTTQLSLFRLSPGDNHIQVLYNTLDSGGNPNAFSKISFVWRNLYLSIDAACATECARGL